MKSRTRTFILIALAALATAGCEGSRLDQFLSQVQEGPSRAAINHTASPSPLPIPTASSSPLPIPIPTLDAASIPDNSNEQPNVGGPWLVGEAFGDPGQGNEIRVLDVDGAILTRLTHLGFPALDPGLTSSRSGARFAFRTAEHDVTETQMSLHIMELPGPERVVGIRLLNPDLAIAAGEGPWPDALGNEGALMAIWQDWHVPKHLWSPDGRYLAFVGAMDGPSADVYAYDSLSQKVVRLTDGHNQPILLGWSPDSRWVVHTEVTDLRWSALLGCCDYDPVAVWAADVDGGPARLLYESEGGYGAREIIVGWRSERDFVAAYQDHSSQIDRLTSVNIATGDRKTLYEGTILSAAVDPQTGTLAYTLYADDFFGGSQEPAATPAGDQVPQRGIYLLQLGEEAPVRLDFDPWRLVYGDIEWLPEAGRFVSARTAAIAFSSDGNVIDVYDEGLNPMASPDGKWLAFQRAGAEPGIGVYSLDGELAYEVVDIQVGAIVWENDSSGFYLLPGIESEFHELFFFPVPDGKVVTVHSDPGFFGNPLMLLYP